MPTLFDPLTLGEITIPNRIVMAPLTRCRAINQRTPNALMAEYYVQRATAGLILTEATSISPMGVGYVNTPGIWSDEQVEGWRVITDAVHARGGLIFSQLWHVGRISHPDFLDGRDPVAPSAIAHPGHISQLRPKRPYPVPRALEADELPGVVDDYRQAAINAQRAGFDGVEIHGANGYLLDQFLQDSINRRTDAYGGPVEHRARLMLEVTDACIDVWGAGRVGMHLAPRTDLDSDPAATFGYVACELGARKIAFLCAREHLGDDSLGPALKRAFGGPYIVNEDFTRDTAQATLDAGTADAVAFGKLFIANPDLPRRFRDDTALNAPDPTTFYGDGAEGYTDYPFLDRSSDTAASHA
ncbi:MAG: alkene reductase [Planctomycetota bacterium]|nr:MAG: alkene reductase [Planctomycetota bacterium]